MKKQNHIFNELLRRYNKYQRKRKNLMLSNKNRRRQVILAKHIERLFEKLMSLKLSITKGTVAVTVALGALAFIPQAITAQNFGAAQTNPFGLISLTSYSAPTFADLDGDGDFDLMSGDDANGNFMYFKNIGTNSTPIYDTVQTNPFGLTVLARNSAPSFVDLDGDGDFDLMAGDRPGNFIYFENTGSNTAPAFAISQTNPFGLIGLGGSYGYGKPTFVDMDNDGDFDMVSGDYYGNFIYFENTGSNIAPAFAVSQTNPFGLVGLGGQGYSSPTFSDLDGDGDFDMLSGQYYGDFYYFENIGSNVAPTFSVAQVNPFGITGLSYNSSPTFVDLDGDGDIDMLSGEDSGNFYYFENIVGVGIKDNNLSNNLFIYPSPTKGLFTISFSDVSTKTTLVIYSATGEEISNQIINNNKTVIDLTTYDKGMYFIKVQNKNKVTTKRIIKQ